MTLVPEPGSPVKFVKCTRVQYDMCTKDSNTIYMISDEAEVAQPRIKKKCKNCGGWGWSDTNSCEYCSSSLD